jgi:nitroimidazol reductase NimA-like FMN-containing flavoprotein (pyridoxamine 5'-phosphate oxidase superfamily)
VHVRSGPWTESEIEAFLVDTVIPVRVASNGRDGVPMVQSMWFRYEDGGLWCATQSDAVLAQRLGADPHVGFEVAGDAMPYHGVRGTGRAEVLAAPAAAVLRSLIDRYHGDADSPFARWLMARVDTEVAIRITDLAVVSWDYRDRMGHRGPVDSSP